MAKLCTAQARKSSGAKALIAEIRYGPAKQLAEKVRTEQEAVPQGLNLNFLYGDAG